MASDAIEVGRMRGCDCVWQDEEVPSRFDGMRGCDRVSGRGKCAIAFEEDEGMRSRLGEGEEGEVRLH